MFSASNFLPEALPNPADLQPAANLASVFEDIHNYVYANEGMLKDKIFNEVVRLLALKLHDEQHHSTVGLRFGITAPEFAVLARTGNSEFLSRLRQLQVEVIERFPRIFPDIPFQLKPLSLANAVAKLQLVSLHNTSQDAKGEAFQTFVYRHQRGDRGEFFTPIPIVRLAVEILAPTPTDRIIDPACGSGGFLIEVISYIFARNPSVMRSSYIQEQVRGIEFNPDIALSATIRLAFEGAAGQEISCDNSLLSNPSLDASFDLVLTNPPFGSKGKVEDRAILRHYELARKWTKTPSSEWEPSTTVLPGQTPEILFIEKCLRLLRPGGRLAIVLPEGTLQNVSYSYVRSWIRRHASPIAVIGIPQEAFIPYGTGIKTSLLVLQKGHEGSPQATFMGRIHKIGYDVKGQPTYRRSSSDGRTLGGMDSALIDEDVTTMAEAFRRGPTEEPYPPELDSFFLPAIELNSRLDVDHYRPLDQLLISRLSRASSKPLSSIASILQLPDSFRSDGTEQIRYVAISDVDAISMSVVSSHLMHPSEAPSRATYRLKAGDIITAISGASTGTAQQATTIVSADDEGVICSNGFAVLRDVSQVDPHFLLAFMRTEEFLNQVRRLMTGHAIPAISTADLGKVLVPIPGASEQRQIAEAMRASLEARAQSAVLASKALHATKLYLRRLAE